MKRFGFVYNGSMWLALLAGLTLSAPGPTGPSVQAQTAPRVELVARGERWELLRNGRPYFIKGAGASTRLQDLVAAGANSIRTWGVDEHSGQFLDRCHALSLSVTVGFWMRKHDGFSYKSQADKDAQYEELKKWVRKYRNHPAILMWAVGNEQELGTEWPEVFIQTDRLIRMVKEEDPTRPVMTVLADMWPEKQQMIERHMTSPDLLGINSYNGLSSLHERMTFWKKPYVITEWQFDGYGDGSPQTPWGTPIEPSTTEKARRAERLYRDTILRFPGRVLGSYLFVWNQSEVAPVSTHGTHMATGDKLAIVDTMTRLWGGRAAFNRVPEVSIIQPNAPQVVRPGEEITLKVETRDPEGDRLTLKYEIRDNDLTKRYVGDFEQEMTVRARGRWEGNTLRLKMPTQAGVYRILITARDGWGGGAADALDVKVEAGG